MTYLFFQQGTDLDAAVRRYFDKFGKLPEKIYTVTGRLWLGPVPEDECQSSS